MAKVPKEYEPAIELAKQAQAKVSTQLKPNDVAKKFYKILQSMVQGQESEEFDTSLLSYVAFNMVRVFKRIQGVAAAYPPTKRKGVGEDGGIKQVEQDDWMWYFSGTEGGPTGGGGEDEDDVDDIPDGTFDWAPDSEISRARDMLNLVAKELDFGPYDDPLPFVREVAKRLGGRWGLNGKRGNANDPSKDVLAWNIPGFLPQIFDCIQDAGGDNKISWLPLRYGQASVWIAP